MPCLGRIRRRRGVADQRNTGKTRPLRQPIRKTRGSSNPSNEAGNTSRIENLPTEILELIFIEEPNPHLPLSSPVLFNKLSGTQLKVNLVLRYFTCIRVVSSIWVSREDIDRALEERPDIADIQTSLLRSSWLNYSFLQKCQLQFYTTNAIKLLQQFLLGIDDQVRTREIALLGARITNYFNRFRDNAPLDDPQYWTCSYTFNNQADGSVFSCYFPTTSHADCGYMNIKVTNSSSYSQWQSVMGNESCLHLQLPVVAKDTRLPTKLLGKPWSQERGDMLTLLLGTDWPSLLLLSVPSVFDKQVLSDALYSAIEENCLLAVQILADSPHIWSLEGMDESTYNRPFNKGIIVRYATGENTPFESTGALEFVQQNHSWKDNHGPLTNSDTWVVLKGYPKEKNYHPAYIVRAKHLLLAIHIADKNGDREIRLFRLLIAGTIHFHRKSIFDSVFRVISQKYDDRLQEKDSVYYIAFRWLSEYVSRQRIGPQFPYLY